MNSDEKIDEESANELQEIIDGIHQQLKEINEDNARKRQELILDKKKCEELNEMNRRIASIVESMELAK